MMKWNFLKNNRCPKCNSPLENLQAFHKCSSKMCSFSCSKEKFDEIINNLYKRKIKPIE